MRLPRPVGAYSLRDAVSRRVSELTRMAQELCEYPRPRVEYVRNGASAGRAHYDRNTIVLHETLLEENPDDMLEHTVGHEVAHLVAFRIAHHKGCGHGRIWKSVMAHFGLPANRTHGYDLSNAKVRRQRRWIYTCPCDTHFLTTVRHNRSQEYRKRGIELYRCRKCHKSLTFKCEASDEERKR